MKERIEDCVRRLYEALKRKKDVLEYVEAVKKKEYLAINNYMFSNMGKGAESFVVRLDDGEIYYRDPVKIRVTKVRKKKMTWDLDKLLSYIGKVRYNKIVTKHYTVNNMPGLIAYLKKCNVDPKEFRKYISVEQKLNEDILESMLEKGEINEGEIKTCYNVEIGEPYFRLTEMKS